jgi:hypothetical protein
LLLVLPGFDVSIKPGASQVDRGRVLQLGCHSVARPNELHDHEWEGQNDLVEIRGGSDASAGLGVPVGVSRVVTCIHVDESAAPGPAETAASPATPTPDTTLISSDTTPTSDTTQDPDTTSDPDAKGSWHDTGS